MDQTDLIRCLQTLREKPGWFIRKDTVAEKIRCLETIKTIGAPSDIYLLFEFLSGDNVLIKTKAAETIVFLFAKLKSLNDYATTLKHLPVKAGDLDFYRVDFDETTYVQLLGLASVNGSGYVRERAVREIAGMKNADGLKFVFLRLADWVPAVRNAAADAILSFLEKYYIDHFLLHLRTIDWLMTVQRVDLSKIHDRILDFVLSQEQSKEFLSKIDRLDDQTRLLYYKALLRTGSPGREQAGRMMNDSNFLIRLELLRRLSDFDSNAQVEILTRFLKDRSARIRQEALYASQNFAPKFDDQIYVLLSDEASSVRAPGRYMLRDRGIDFVELYKSRIVDQQSLAGSLPGLSETGSKEHLPVFLHHIHSRSSKVVVACLTAINRFDADIATEHALERINSPRKRIRDKSTEILAKNPDLNTIQKLRAIYATGDDAIKKTILILYNRIGGWHVVGDLMLALADGDEEIAKMAWQFLEKWKIRAIRLFTTAPANEAERTQKIFDGLDLSRLRMTKSRANLLQDLKFFLR